MKKLHLLIIASAMSMFSIAQIPRYDTGIISQNNASALFTSDGSMNFRKTGLSYYVPKDSMQATIFCGSLWVGGLDAGKQLHIAAQTYHQNGTDFWPGPIMNTYSTHEDTIWNYVWLIHKSTIDSFRQGKYGSNIPASIKNWPGNGDISLGEMANLAPYKDSDHNGMYDPSGGDYPLIRGDEALFTISNDARNKHTETGGMPLGIEVHLMVYQFTSADTAINEATFLHYDIYNRSKNNYDSIYFGSWIDMDVGNGGLNYIGCDSANNYWFTYCSSNNEANGSGSYSGEKGYHLLPPAQSLAYMCDTMTHFMNYNNDFTVQGNPTNPGGYYDYLKNIWLDATHTTIGGDGYGGIIPTNYVYSGNPQTLTGWSEITANIPANDVRGLSSAGPYKFNSGTRKSLDLALVFSQNFPGNNLGSVSLAGVYTNRVKNFYNSQSYGCDENLMGVPEINAGVNTFSAFIYPNPNNGIFTVSFRPVSNVPTTIEIYNFLGQRVYNATMKQVLGNIQINISSQPSGVYFYRVLTLTGELQGMGKIVKE